MNERSWRARPSGYLLLKILIGLNVLVYLYMISLSPAGEAGFVERFAVSSDMFDSNWGWSRLVTYQFLHANVQHILFNMITLAVFGLPVLARFGWERFTYGYLLCGMCGGVVSWYLNHIGFIDRGPQHMLDNFLLIGASGSVNGVIMCCAVLNPPFKVRLLLPPIALTMRQCAIMVLAIDTFVVVFDLQNSGGMAAHLGGALMGVILTLLGLKWDKSHKHGA